MLRRLGAWLSGPPARVTGRPTSRNGASSFHLWWELASSSPLREVSVVLEVVEPPQVDRLYFWALQVGFSDGRTRFGGAHLGLQWNARHPGHGAVNWGGYRSGGGLLEGSSSLLPSARDDRNTRDYLWSPGTPYRLRVSPAPGEPGAWRGEVTDLASGVTTAVRDLYAGGDRLVDPVMWSEVFADCDHPSVTVRWAEPAAVTATGDVVAPKAFRVNYQSHQNGGCANTDSRVAGDAIEQITAVPRATPQGTTLRLTDG